jgi:hypothetical protein
MDVLAGDYRSVVVGTQDRENRNIHFRHDLHKRKRKIIQPLIYPSPWAIPHPTGSSSSKDRARSYYAPHPYTWSDLPGRAISSTDPGVQEHGANSQVARLPATWWAVPPDIRRVRDIDADQSRSGNIDSGLGPGGHVRGLAMPLGRGLRRPRQVDCVRLGIFQVLGTSELTRLRKM